MAIRQHQEITRDTSIDAHERQIAAWIAMGPEQRVRLAASMSDETRRVSLEGRALRAEMHEGIPKSER
jgi:hypothetical protein